MPAGRRPLYDAATTLVSGFLLPVLDLSARLMTRAGVAPDDALPALLPLMHGTLASAAERGVPQALHGPVARGDVETAALHLRALDPEDQRLYALVGTEVARLGEQHLDPSTRAALADLFARYMELETTGTGSG